MHAHIMYYVCVFVYFRAWMCVCVYAICICMHVCM